MGQLSSAWHLPPDFTPALRHQSCITYLRVALLSLLLHGGFWLPAIHKCISLFAQSYVNFCALQTFASFWMCSSILLLLPVTCIWTVWVLSAHWVTWHLNSLNYDLTVQTEQFWLQHTSLSNSPSDPCECGLTFEFYCKCLLPTDVLNNGSTYFPIESSLNLFLSASQFFSVPSRNVLYPRSPY